MPLSDATLKSIPVLRPAYNVTMAWLMAEISRLAYVKFEGKEKEVVDQAVKELTSLQKSDQVKDALERVLKSYFDRSKGLGELKASLNKMDLELVTTFDNGGTQAFLARRKSSQSDKVAVLAFRGTEKDLKDIRTDLNARFYKKDGARVHDGFRQAFALVRDDIAKELTSLDDQYDLYLTGHSLGGALAIVAAQELETESVAACYTFGSPRIGDYEFGAEIRIPVYRVVNAADIVPRLPPTWLFEVLNWLLKLVPIRLIRDAGTNILERFRGYRHYGDMRYLTTVEDGSELRVISNPNMIDRTL